jgi:hypothetical protein
VKRLIEDALSAAIATAVFAVGMFVFFDANLSFSSVAIYFAFMLAVYLGLSFWRQRRGEKSE